MLSWAKSFSYSAEMTPSSSPKKIIWKLRYPKRKRSNKFSLPFVKSFISELKAKYSGLLFKSLTWSYQWQSNQSLHHWVQSKLTWWTSKKTTSPKSLTHRKGHSEIMTLLKAWWRQITLMTEFAKLKIWKWIMRRDMWNTNITWIKISKKKKTRRN